MQWRATRDTKSACVWRPSADLQKSGLRDRKRSGALWRLVKLQRPPPEIRILAPTRSVCSSSSPLRPRCLAVRAHIKPAAPAPRTMTSNACAAAVIRPGSARRRQARHVRPECLHARARYGRRNRNPARDRDALAAMTALAKSAKQHECRIPGFGETDKATRVLPNPDPIEHFADPSPLLKPDGRLALIQG